MMQGQKAQIIQEGMGGCLCPPGHPMLTQCVETDLRRKPGNRTHMSLEEAMESPLIDAATRRAVKTILRTWERSKLPLTDPAVREWILQVLGYFAGCYCRGDGSKPEDWHCANLVITGTKQGKEPGRKLTVDQHAGVHLIREYYPDYTPADADFANAYWGKKPCESP